MRFWCVNVEGNQFAWFCACSWEIWYGLHLSMMSTLRQVTQFVTGPHWVVWIVKLLMLKDTWHQGRYDTLLCPCIFLLCVILKVILVRRLILLMVILVQKCSGSLSEGFSQTQVSTLAVKDNLLIAGGFQGELICKVSHAKMFQVHLSQSSWCVNYWHTVSFDISAIQ
jgi:hypothetical protein